MIRGTKRLIGVAYNTKGQVSQQTVTKLRDKARRVSDASQTIFFNDTVNGGQSCFVFEIYDAKDTSFVKRIGYNLSKWVAAAFSYMRNGVFVTVIIEN